MSNIIEVTLGGKSVVKTLPVYQYDYGMILRVMDDLPAAFRADFSNEEHGESKPVFCDSHDIEIPYEYMVPGQTIHCWLVELGESSGVTFAHIEIPIDKRAYDTGTIPDGYQRNELDRAIGALDDALEHTEEKIREIAHEAVESGELNGPKGDKGDTGDPGTQIEVTKTQWFHGGPQFNYFTQQNEAELRFIQPDGTTEEVVIKDGFTPLFAFGTGMMALYHPHQHQITVKYGPGNNDGKTINWYDGITFIPSVNDGILSWTNDQDAENPDPVDIRGPKGDDGESPTLYISKRNGVTTIIATDKNGVTASSISDGAKGATGPQGPQGPKGDPGESFTAHICSVSEYDSETLQPTVSNPSATELYLTPSGENDESNMFYEWIFVNGHWERFGAITLPVPDVSGLAPTAGVTKVGNTATITITDANGTTTATVQDGTDGSPGAKGDKGDKGDTGDKGDKGDKGDAGDDYILTAQDKADIADEISFDAQQDVIDLKNAIGYADAVPDQPVYAQINQNSFWNSENSTAAVSNYNNYSRFDAVPVSAGEAYEIDIVQKTSAKQNPVLLTDDSLVIKARHRDTNVSLDGWVHFEFTVPEGATKMLLTSGVYQQSWRIPTIIKKGSVGGLNSVPLLKSRVDKLEKPLYGKTVAIIGDSISTNGNPGSGDYPNAVEITVTDADVGVELSAYLTKYDVDAGLSLGGHIFTSSEIGTEVTFTPIAADVGKVIGLPNNYNANNAFVWWEVVADEFGFTPIPVCWSGASVTSHEASSDDYKTAHAWHDAQIRKCGIRTPGAMTRTAPDMIILYRGTNDFSHSSYAKLTDDYFDDYNWQYPEDDAVTGGYGYKEGLCLTVKKLRAAYPNAQIWLCTLNVFKRVNYSHFPTNNGINSLPQYNAAIREVAMFLGCGVIDFAADGITFENCYSGGYITDSSTTPTHPSDKGHMVMGQKAIADIRAHFNDMD